MMAETLCLRVQNGIPAFSAGFSLKGQVIIYYEQIISQQIDT